MEVERRSPSLTRPALADAVSTPTLVLFSGTIFAAAVLVFAVQPMVAKMLLPSFGGTPAVWAVSLVFFQAVLLAGYAFAHYSVRLVGVRRQALLQLPLLLVPFLALPIAVPDSLGGGSPNVRLLSVLAVAAGLPFFVVTTASPVLQRWFATGRGAAARDPYFLYAASNAGSLLGLLAYPVLIEPRLTLAEQARAWTLGYAVFAVLAALCARRVFTVPDVAAAPRTAPKLRLRTRMRWIAMAALPSSLMVGTTTHLSTDIAALPLLWVVPLALYLLSFVVAFARSEPLSQRTISGATVVSSLLVVLSLLPVLQLPVWAVVGIHGLNLFFVALLVHRRLARERPPAERLTDFYLLLSLGGVLGGAFNALAAPVLFTTVAEYPIAIVLALLLRPGAWRPPAGRFLRRNADLLLPFALLVGVLGGAHAIPSGIFLRLYLVAGVVAVALFAARPVRFALGVAALLLITAVPQPALHAERTFFGTLRVVEDGDRHAFVHGTTVHGAQSFAPGRRNEPLAYYTREGPLGQLFAALDGRAHRVGLVGLGTGAAAAYGRPGDRYTFFEIDDAVVRIASDPRLFTYLRDSQADVRVVLGDGRLKLAEEPPGAFDLLVLDAFSSDSVPVHLLTREAAAGYLRKLAPGGVVAFHISNRYLDLEPVIGGLARALDLVGLVQAHGVSHAAAESGAASSIWVVAARNSSAFGPLARDRRWDRLDTGPGRPVWTDQSSNIVGAIKWFAY